MTFIENSTFEFASACVTGSALTILVIVVYRPGSAAVSELFFDDFSDLLGRTSTYASSLIITGDLNIHLDVTSDLPSSISSIFLTNIVSFNM